MEVLYAIPGLGTTKEFFASISVPNFEIKVLSWPVTKAGMSMRDYAECFLEQIDRAQICNFLGVSFGGMLCVELATMVNTNKLVLISSCKNRSEFPPYLKAMKFMALYSLLSDDTWRWLAKKLYRVLGIPLSFKEEYFCMIDSMHKNYFKHSLQAIFRWKRKNIERRVLHLQGTRDLVLPHLFVRNYTPISKGSHSMVFDRTDEINPLLDAYFNGR